MKQIYLKGLFFVLLSVIFTPPTWASDFEVDDIYYNILTDDEGNNILDDDENPTVEVTHETDAYNSYSGDVTIPETVTYNGKTYTVTGIGEYAFYECSSLESITLPSSLTSISSHETFDEYSALTTVYYNATNCDDIQDFSGNYPFSPCSNLTSIIIGSNVQYIPANLFRSSTAKTVTFQDDSQLDSIGKYAFYECKSLESINLPESLETIGEGVFSYCSALESIYLPKSITSISNNSPFSECTALTTVYYNATNCEDTQDNFGNFLFSSCTNLTNIIIDEDVEYIPANLFYGCSTITSLTFNATNCESSGTNAFDEDSSISSLTIGKDVTTIPDVITSMTDFTSLNYNASTTSTELLNDEFFSNNKITELTIGEDVSTIPDKFSQLSSLTTVTYNAANAEIPDNSTNPVFAECTYFTTLTIGEDVETISPYIFQKCTALSIINFNAKNFTGDSYSVDNSLFMGCTAIQEVNIGDSVTILPKYLFEGYYSGEEYLPNLTSINIPSSVTTIEEGVFEYCTNLDTVTFDENSQLTTIGKSAFANCYSLESIDIPSGVTLIDNFAFRSCTKLASINLPSSLTTIGDNAFADCLALTSIEIPSSITSIGIYVFSDCSALTSINLPSSITSIGEYAFCNCTSIESFEIPSSVTSIGVCAFSNCTSIEEIYASSTTPAECGDNAFDNVPSDCVLYVPVGSEDNYSDTEAWNYFTYVTGVYYTSVTDGVITLKAPTESEISCDSIAAGDEIVVVVDASGTMTVTVHDTESSVTLYNGDIENIDTISASSYKYTWTCPSDITLYNDHTYALDIALSENGSATLITYNGTTDNIVLESYTPDENDTWTVAEDKDIVLTFSGLVKVEEANINGQTTTLNATGSDTTDDGYSSVWTLTVSADDVATYSTILISVTAVNHNGDTIYDEDGNDITLSYTVNILTDGINAVNAATKDDRIYNLSGQRVNNLNRRGIYILNGNKVTMTR